MHSLIADSSSRTGYEPRTLQLSLEMEDHRWTIDKLDSNNWITWKFKIMHLLKAKGLWKYVDGSTEPPGEDADADVIAAFEDKSEKAFSTIVIAISTPQLYLVTSCVTPVDVLKAFTCHFQQATLANKVLLKKQYFRKEMTEGELHLKEMKELTDKLSSVGAPISHEDQVVTLLGSLPSSYSTLVMALEARIDDISIDYVQQTLLQEEKKRDVSAGELSTPMSINTALYGGDKRAKHPKTPVCWKCNETGHVQRFCPNKERKSQAADHKVKVTKSESEDEGEFTASNNYATHGWLDN